MRRPWFLPALPVGLGPKWRGTSDYSSKGTDLNKAFLLSDCLKLQNWCFHSAWSTVSSLQYNRHSWLHECSGSASLSFQRPEVTARPVISLSVLVNRPSTYLHLNEDSNWQSSICMDYQYCWYMLIIYWVIVLESTWNSFQTACAIFSKRYKYFAFSDWHCC